MSDSDTNPTRDAERQRMQDELRRPLLPALIARRDSRDYLPIPQAITQANRIFGPGNWRTEIKSHTAITDDKGMVTGYKCIVRVTVETLGTCFEGVGFEQMTRRRGDTSSLQTPQAHDTAMKGAESDAVKRALRYFGDAFGNALYEKDDERERVFRFVVDAIDRGEIGTKEAERMILGPIPEAQGGTDLNGAGRLLQSPRRGETQRRQRGGRAGRFRPRGRDRPVPGSARATRRPERRRRAGRR